MVSDVKGGERWLDSATVYALGLVVIASVYVGFAVADGRPKVIAAPGSGLW